MEARGYVSLILSPVHSRTSFPPHPFLPISLIMFAARSSLRFAAARNGSYAGLPRSLIARNMNSKPTGKRTSQLVPRHHLLNYTMHCRTCCWYRFGYH